VNTLSLTTFRSAVRSVGALPERALEKLRPTKLPDFLKAQAESLGDFSPYEAYMEFDRPTCLLADGSLGVIWELASLPHEVMSHTEIERRIGTVAEIMEKVRSPEATFQIIFDAEPSHEIEAPANIKAPITSAEKIIAARIEATEQLGSTLLHKLRLMKRKVYLSIRLSDTRSIATRSILNGNESELEAEAKELSERAQKLKQHCDEIEYNLGHAGVAFRALTGGEFLSLVRATLHDTRERAESELLKREEPRTDTPLREQILRNFCEFTPHAVGVGNDTWEVASWIDQPPTVYAGMCARLLEIDTAHRLVVNLRTCTESGDLETKKALLKNATDSFGELQRGEVKATQDRIARGESLTFVSMHLLVRNEARSVHDVALNGVARSVVSRLKTLTQINFIVEKYAAPAIFLMTLPFGFSAASAPFTGRERRVLSRNVAPYLPLFGGFQGTRTPFQLMVSRAGNSVWLNPFDSETSAHVAVLASSGGGKSFFAQNMMMSFFAKEGRVSADGKVERSPLLFVIDKKTSYEIFARVVGEDFGAQIIKPPAEFPNIFRGRLDEFRLPVIVGVLKTAISLVTENARVGAIEEMLLSQAVRATFEHNELDARTEYTEGNLQERRMDRVKIPRLSDVLDNLFPICAKSTLSTSVAETLTGYLAPFVGNGPYAALFDREEFDEADPATPGVSLFDIDAVSGHPVLSTLTTQVILCEILRQIRRPENRGKPGMLVIEEAGVLAGSSPELVSFISDAWKTFRKLGFSCVGLTNEVDDYARKPGPREIWNVSPNKIILRMLEKDLQKAVSGSADGAFPPLIEDKHIGELIGSLTKKDGAYSQGLWWSDEAKGTFVFIPTGFDYWCAASKPIEVETVYEVSTAFGNAMRPYFSAVKWLAENFPMGVRHPHGGLRKLTETELAEARERRV
jgi:hypothetical protein